MNEFLLNSDGKLLSICSKQLTNVKIANILLYEDVNTNLTILIKDFE